jgi:hypothetical protein
MILMIDNDAGSSRRSGGRSATGARGKGVFR